MQYLFRQHYSLKPGLQQPELKPNILIAPSAPTQLTVLIAEPNPETMAMYKRHLDEDDVAVYLCADITQTGRYVQHIKPKVLVINPAPNLTASLNILKQVMIIQPSLSVITIGSLIPEFYLDKLMSLGVSLHINRSLSQPRDLATAVKRMLY